MDNVGCVHVVAARQDLEHEVLQVVVGQVLPRVDDAMHIRLHQLSDDVDVLVASLGGRLGNVEDFDDVFVVEEL